MACKTSISVAILLLLGSKSSLGCYGGGEKDLYYEWDKDPTPGTDHGGSESESGPRLNVTHIRDTIERNKKIVWGGWTPSPDVEKDWRNWLHNYQLGTNKTNYANAGNKDRLQQEREKEGNWPPRWEGLGEGIGGAAPPPWAYAPKYTGKPDACNRSPGLGTCKEKLQRWGWNPYLEKCMTYTWSGCGGTSNNFLTKLRCEEICAVPALSSCDTDSGIPIADDADISSK